MLVDVKVPVLAESVSEATLMNWNKQTGDSVKRGDSLIDIETDKVTLEVAAPNDGILREILKPDGESVTSDEVIARIETSKSTAVTVPQPESVQQSLIQEESSSSIKQSPAVRHLLQEHSLDVAAIPATGRKGRLTKEDVINHLDTATPETSQTITTPKTEPSVVIEPIISDDTRPSKRVAMTRLRKRTAERLLTAQHQNAILTTFNEVNMQPIMDLRSRYNDEFEKSHGIKLGYMSFFTRAVIEALKKYPIINASVDGADIIYHGYFDIGIAVSSPRGLVVPILRDADTLSFAGIETSIRELTEKSRESKLTIEELTGGTFTITNGGVFGSLLSTPILNPPQSAILGMHKIQQRPIAENGEVVIRPMMYLALSYDHRIIDGREAVQFLVSVKQQIEDPARLLLQV